MESSLEEPRRRRPTGIALAVLFVVILGAVGALVFAGGGDDTPHKRVASAATTTISTFPPATAPKSSTTAPPTAYVVMKGDTLTSIGQKFGVTTKAILAINQISNPDSLTEGEKLKIPAKPPLQLVVSPHNTVLGVSVSLKLTGAKPGESVTFEIQSPSGTFKGPPHVASDEGTVTTKYATALADPPGTYNVVATGSQGTTAQGSFRVRRG
ncbi:MAG TPA: LysM peptidoglycan-binding domain-containing protein [Acidimicrobiia bacterium]